MDKCSADSQRQDLVLGAVSHYQIKLLSLQGLKVKNLK